jgi:hypothetical protein
MGAIRFDDKGKFYTEVVAKVTVKATIQTTTHQIQGYIHVRQDERVKDELNRNEKFLAVTDAIIMDPNGNITARCGFISVNRDQIIWLFPADDQLDDTQPGGKP